MRKTYTSLKIKVRSLNIAVLTATLATLCFSVFLCGVESRLCTALRCFTRTILNISCTVIS